jgi:hypothetical protein
MPYIFDKTIPWSPGLDIGNGVFGQPFIPRSSSAVDFDPPQTTTQTVQPDIEWYLASVTTLDEVMETLGIDVDIKVNTYVYGNYSANVAFEDSTSSSRFQNYIVVSARVTTGWRNIRNPRFKPEAEQTLHNRNDQFRFTYGEGVVKGELDGGILNLIIIAETENTRTQRKIEFETSAEWLNVVDVDVGVEHSLETLSEASSIKVICKQLGGSSTTVPTTLPAAIEKLETFTEDVINRPHPFYVRIGDYLDVPTDFPNFIDVQHQKQVIKSCGQDYLRLMNIRNDIHYILGHRDQFLNVGQFNLDVKLSQINHDLNVLKNAADTCYNNIQACMFPEEIINFDYELPTRRSGQPPGGTVPPVIDFAALAVGHRPAPGSELAWVNRKPIIRLKGDNVRTVALRRMEAASTNIQR